jgi:phosphoribosylformimino-5-aminoimidazole carboxamide ribotide isomerase
VINSQTNILLSLMMQIIPVIDLLNGAVVHAQQGQRQNYKPIKSLLTHSSKPLDIVAALLDVYPFSQLYIADLNAIQQFGDNFNAIRAVAQKFPQLMLWIDVGAHSIQPITHSGVILGSENFPNDISGLENFLAYKNQQKERFVLSLDFMSNGYQGPAELLESSQYWPQDVIVMSLQNVGANQGANANLMQKMLTLASGKNIYAAGGIRHVEDLIALKNMGVHGALVATALHHKQLSADEIKNLSQ